MVKKIQKLPHAQAIRHAKRLLDKGNSISQTIQQTQLSHTEILRIKNEDM